MTPGVDRQSGHGTRAPSRPAPPRRDAAVRDAEAGAEGVVDQALRPDPLLVGQPGVTERRGSPPNDDGGGHVLRMTAWIGPDFLFLSGGRGQDRLGDGLQAWLTERLQPRRRQPG